MTPTTDVRYYVHMDTKHTISISEARKRIFEIADEVQQPDTHYVLTENGKPKAVILSAEEFESLIETLEVMEEFPDLEKDIQEVERDIKSGAFENYSTLEELLEKEGFLVADKGKQKYGVSNKVHSAGRKRNRETPRK